MEEKKILLLRSCKADFEKLANGQLKARYLEVKKYWETRVLDSDGTPKVFDEVHIKNGYNSDSPLIKLEFKGNKGVVEYEGKDCFEIELGEILGVENYNN